MSVAKGRIASEVQSEVRPAGGKATDARALEIEQPGSVIDLRAPAAGSAPLLHQPELGPPLNLPVSDPVKLPLVQFDSAIIFADEKMPDSQRWRSSRHRELSSALRGAFVSTSAEPIVDWLRHEDRLGRSVWSSNHAVGFDIDNDAPDEHNRRAFVANALVLSMCGSPSISLRNVVNDPLPDDESRDSALPLANRLPLANQLRTQLMMMARIRSSQPALGEFTAEHVLNVHSSVVAFERHTRNDEGADERIMCLHNVSDMPVRIWTGAYEFDDLVHGLSRGATIVLRPYEVTWLRYGAAIE